MGVKLTKNVKNGTASTGWSGPFLFFDDIMMTRRDTMAKNTNIALRNQMFYQVYNRQHNPTGTFLELIQDLPRIKNLGTDVLYLLPIHPIGQKQKKGDLGCPYSISDYMEVNPEYGTLEDFKQLVKASHDIGLKVMIDVVFNHTSHDARLLAEHPEWYYRKDGKLAGKVGDWWDITDLDFTQPLLWDELIKTLKYWASLGVDGYRCDVASMVPMAFWMRARHEIAQINPDFIWLAESIHIDFVKYIRDSGFEAASDSEVFEAFDITYDYDIIEDLYGYLKGEKPLNLFLELLKRQEGTYPANYVKLHFLDNHDQERVAARIKDPVRLVNLTAALFFFKGTTLIYAGQEAANTHRPDLFGVDKVDWKTYNEHGLADLISQMARIKKEVVFAYGVMNIHMQKKEAIVISHENPSVAYLGIFNVGNKTGYVTVPFEDGNYQNVLDGKTVVVENNQMRLRKTPVVLVKRKTA